MANLNKIELIINLVLFNIYGTYFKHFKYAISACNVSEYIARAKYDWFDLIKLFIDCKINNI